MRLALAAVVTLAAAGAGRASGTIYYGSRAGMVVDVVSVSGLSTANAMIRTRHTRANATAFCREYVGKITADCIRDELAAPLNVNRRRKLTPYRRPILALARFWCSGR